jgi:transposase, IS6 family
VFSGFRFPSEVISVVPTGHAFVQNLGRGHYDIATETPGRHRLRIAFDELALTI